MKTDRNVHLPRALHPSLSNPLSIYVPPISFLHSPPFICCHSVLMARLQWQNTCEGLGLRLGLVRTHFSAFVLWKVRKPAIWMRVLRDAACGICPVAADSFWANPGRSGWALWLRHQIRAQVLSCVCTLAFIPASWHLTELELGLSPTQWL